MAANPPSPPASQTPSAVRWWQAPWLKTLLGAVVVLILVGCLISRYQAMLLLLFLVLAAGLVQGAQLWIARVDNHKYLPKPEDRLQNKDAVVILAKSVLVAIVGVYVALAAAHACFPMNYSATGLVATWALAGLSLGGGIGFLFGHPRIESNGENGGAKARLKVQSSTSLDQINDWLTKAILGVGLVEAKQILKFGYLLATDVGHGLSGHTVSPADPVGYALASAILVMFPLIGFVTSYLVTRTFVALALCRAEVALSGTASGVSEKQLEDYAKDTAVEDPAGKVQAPPLDIAQKLGSLPLSAVENPTEVIAWAKLKASQGHVEEAESGFQKALKMPETDNAGVALQAARTRAVDEPEGLEWVRKAYRQMNASTDAALKEQIYNSLMFRLLYTDGCDEAIRYGEEYLSDPANKVSGALLVNLACAYGQKAAKLKAANAPQEEFNQVRDKALDCVRKALADSPGWKQRCALLYNPNAPEKSGNDASKEENDLEAFYPDPAFDDLLIK